jgi:hypothetical protein
MGTGNEAPGQDARPDPGFVGGPMASEMGDPTADAAKPPGASPPGAPAPASAPAAHAAPDALSVLQRENERKDELIRGLLSRAPAASDDRTAPRLAPPGPAPDPIREPEKYRQWAEAGQRYNEQLVRQAIVEGRAEVSESQLRDSLWLHFSQRHADLAQDPELCGHAFRAELDRHGGRVPGDHTAFLDGIAARLRRIGGGKAPERAPAGAPESAGLAGGSAGEARVVSPVTGPKETPKPRGFAGALEDQRQKLLPDLFG